MRVDVRGGLVVGVAHDLHGDQRVDAALVEQRHVVVPEVVRGQRGLDLLEDVVRTGGARLDLPPFHAAAGQHQPRPHALVAGLRERRARRRVEHVSVRRLPLWQKHLLQNRRDGDEAVRGGGLERALRRGGADEVDVPEDVDLIGRKVDVTPLEPQRLAPADAQIVENGQEQALRVGADRLQHAPGLLRGQRPAPGPLGSPGADERDRGIALDHPFRVGRSEDRLQGSDDVVDLGLAGPRKAVDEFLDLRRADGLHVLHAELREKVLNEARLVIGAAGVGDERLLFDPVPLSGVFVKRLIPRNRPAEDIVLPHGLLHVFQLPAGRRRHILVDRLAVRVVADGHLPAELARRRPLRHRLASLAPGRPSALPGRGEEVALAHHVARPGVFRLGHKIRLFGILDVLADGAHVYPAVDPAQAPFLQHAVNGARHHAQHLGRDLLVHTSP